MSSRTEPAREAVRSRFVGVAVLTAVMAVAAITGCGGDGEPDVGRASPSASLDDQANIITSTTAAEVTADDIEVVFTPPGGWTDMPAAVLARCTEPLADGAIDMRGTWKVVSVEAGGTNAPDHDAMGQVQRIEQCGNRVVIAAGGIVHDMRADGTEARGVRDVAASDKITPIIAVATFEDGVHVLRPVGVPVQITRRLEGDQLVWAYVGFTARLERVKAS